MTAKKFDNEKIDLSLLPYHAKCEIAKAFMIGEKKYGRYNYLNGMEWTRLASAAQRHLDQWLYETTFDKESGYNHLGHAGANIMMLLEYQARSLGIDNRYITLGQSTQDSNDTYNIFIPADATIVETNSGHGIIVYK